MPRGETNRTHPSRQDRPSYVPIVRCQIGLMASDAPLPVTNGLLMDGPEVMLAGEIKHEDTAGMWRFAAFDGLSALEKSPKL